MKIGFISACLSEMSFEELIRWASENGFDMMEVACWPPALPASVRQRRDQYAGITHIDVTELSDEKVNRIRRLLKEYGVALSSLAYYENCLTPDKKSREYYISHLKRLISAANRMGVKIVATHVGRDIKRNVEDNLKIYERVFYDIIKYAEEHDVKIAIENCPMLWPHTWPGGANLASTPAIWRKLFEIIPSENLGLNFDPSHLIWQQIDYVKAVGEFQDKIFHTHAKDTKILTNVLGEVGNQGFGWYVFRLPGFGDIDWRRYFAALHEIGYRGVVSIEHEDPNPYWGSSVERKEEALLLSKKYLQQFL